MASSATGPYPPIERWVLPLLALEATFDAVRPGAQRRVESGVFWMGKGSDEATVEAVVMPRPPGVDERPGQWKVSAEVYGLIAQWATPRGLQLLGWVHTHGQGVPARLSHADRTRSIQAPGVLAVVIGSGGHDEDLTRWGWYVYDDGEYRGLDDRERITRVELRPDGAVQRWRASLAGVVEETE